MCESERPTRAPDLVEEPLLAHLVGLGDAERRQLVGAVDPEVALFGGFGGHDAEAY